jgi:hypothetical protein
VQPVCTPVEHVVQVPIIKTVKTIQDGLVTKVVKVVVLVTVRKIVWVCQ